GHGDVAQSASKVESREEGARSRAENTERPTPNIELRFNDLTIPRGKAKRSLNAQGRMEMRFWSVSRAFIREDVDPPERSGRKRSAKGLPPGAVNYITARGAARLQAELAALCAVGDKSERITELKQILSSVKIVDPPDGSSKGVSFGATVTLRDPHDNTETHTIVGVDELDFEPEAVSWISPLGKALLASQLSDRITLEDGRTVKIVKIE